MAVLPPSTDFTGAAVTEGGFKTAITALRDFLSGILGTAGTQKAALTAIGSPFNAMVDISAAYTVVAADRGKVFNATTGTFEIALTASATLGDGFSFSVKNSGTGVVTINPSGTETIDGAATLDIGAGVSVNVVCNGTLFVTVGKASTDADTLDGLHAASFVKVDNGYNQIGSIVIAHHVTAGAAITGGSVYNGSALRSGGIWIDGGGGTLFSGSTSGTLMSGTWRALNSTPGNPTHYPVALFQRLT